MNNEAIKHKRKMIYIMGASYSGSTLLTCIMARHREISTIGELKATSMGEISSYKCGCGKLLTKCEFWQTIASEVKQAGEKFEFDDFGTHFQANSFIEDKLLSATVRNNTLETARNIGFYISKHARNIKEDILRKNHLLVDAICRIQGGSSFLDDSKDPVRVMHFIKAELWDIRVIYLIRDGRGVTNSYMAHHGTSMHHAVNEWISSQQECDRMAKKLGDKCLTIHYENFCTATQEELSRIFSFCELSRNFPESSRIEHLLGNNMRLKPLKEIKLDEKWKKVLSHNDLSKFAQYAGKLNHSYGYE